MASFTTKEVPFGWRVTLALHFLCGAALAIGALVLPETPRKAHWVFSALCLIIEKSNTGFW